MRPPTLITAVAIGLVLGVLVGQSKHLRDHAVIKLADGGRTTIYEPVRNGCFRDSR